MGRVERCFVLLLVLNQYLVYGLLINFIVCASFTRVEWGAFCWCSTSGYRDLLGQVGEVLKGLYGCASFLWDEMHEINAWIFLFFRQFFNFSFIVSPSFSLAGRLGMSLRTALSASTFAMLGFFEGLWEVWRAWVGSVHVLNVCPGVVNTNASLHALMGDMQEFSVTEPLRKNSMTVDRFFAVGFARSCKWSRGDVDVWSNADKFISYLHQYVPLVF